MTTLDLTGLVRPHLVEMTKREDNPNAAEFRLQPLERGYGYTLGNSLRRMLLSSLRGAAVWAFRLDGVVHEHQTIPGVVEDVHQIIQRLKQLTLVLSSDVDEAVMHIKHDKAGPVYARNIEAHSAVTIVTEPCCSRSRAYTGPAFSTLKRSTASSTSGASTSVSCFRRWMI